MPEDLPEAHGRSEESSAESGGIAGMIGRAVAFGRKKGREVQRGIFKAASIEDRREMAREQWGRLTKVKVELAKLIEKSETSVARGGGGGRGSQEPEELLAWKEVFEEINELEKKVKAAHSDKGIDYETYIEAEQLLESTEDILGIKSDADNTAALLGGNGKASGIMGWFQKLPGAAQKKIEDNYDWGKKWLLTGTSFAAAALLTSAVFMTFYLPVWLIDKVEKDVKLK